MTSFSYPFIFGLHRFWRLKSNLYETPHVNAKTNWLLKIVYFSHFVPGMTDPQIRGMVLQIKPEIILTPSGDGWNYKMVTPYKTREVEFVNGQEIDYVSIIGKPVKVRYTLSPETHVYKCGSGYVSITGKPVKVRYILSPETHVYKCGSGYVSISGKPVKVWYTFKSWNPCLQVWQWLCVHHWKACQGKIHLKSWNPCLQVWQLLCVHHWKACQGKIYICTCVVFDPLRRVDIHWHVHLWEKKLLT